MPTVWELQSTQVHALNVWNEMLTLDDDNSSRLIEASLF